MACLSEFIQFSMIGSLSVTDTPIREMDQKWDCQSEHFRLYVRQGGLQMNIPDSCARCLYDKQANRTDDAAYLAEVKAIIAMKL